MITTILLFILGLALVVLGSDALVDGASALARRFHVSEFVIGLTIVGFGTSLPELVVSVNGALNGSGSIALGNVVGSNIFNTLLILGVTAIIAPVVITPSNRKVDIPVVLGLTLLFVGVCLVFGKIDFVWGVVFLLMFAVYMYFSANSHDDAEDGDAKTLNHWIAALMVIGGLVALVLGGRLFVNNAVSIAKAAGVSEKFIAVTLLAGGTSLPELITCIVAASKGKGQLALGNILGSNVFNILLVLGCASLLNPLDASGLSLVDLLTMLLSAVILVLASNTGNRSQFGRFDASLLLLAELGYGIWLFTTL